MRLEDLLVPCDEPITDTRNATPLSRLSEGIVRSFLENRADSATVRHDMTEYGLDELYEGVRRVCKKNDFKGLVRAHKQNGKLVLLRGGKR